jgi:hypothetical protein
MNLNTTLITCLGVIYLTCTRFFPNFNKMNWKYRKHILVSDIICAFQKKVSSYCIKTGIQPADRSRKKLYAAGLYLSRNDSKCVHSSFADSHT